MIRGRETSASTNYGIEGYADEPLRHGSCSSLRIVENAAQPIYYGSCSRRPLRCVGCPRGAAVVIQLHGVNRHEAPLAGRCYGASSLKRDGVPPDRGSPLCRVWKGIGGPLCACTEDCEWNFGCICTRQPCIARMCGHKHEWDVVS